MLLSQQQSQKQQQFHDIDSNSSEELPPTQNLLSLSSAKQEHLRILRSFYKKDASAVCAKSLLGIHEFKINSRSVEAARLNETSSISSQSSASITNKCDVT